MHSLASGCFGFSSNLKLGSQRDPKRAVISCLFCRDPAALWFSSVTIARASHLSVAKAWKLHMKVDARITSTTKYKEDKCVGCCRSHPILICCCVRFSVPSCCLSLSVHFLSNTVPLQCTVAALSLKTAKFLQTISYSIFTYLHCIVTLSALLFES